MNILLNSYLNEIEEIAYAKMTFVRPRVAGRNARRDVHGASGDVHIVRLRSGNVYGYGFCMASKQQANLLIGKALGQLFENGCTLKKEYRIFEFPLLDLAGQIEKRPVYSYWKQTACHTVPVYDSSIYFDEPLGCSDETTLQILAEEMQYGLEHGHRNFKVKVGRSGIWVDVQDGLQRDIKIVLQSRSLIGAEGKLMVDANNGWNYNLTRKFLDATRSAKLYWLEEPFAEDAMLYRRLRDWMLEKDIHTFISDGEGCAVPQVQQWACDGLIDFLQYDMRDHGFFNWIETSQLIQPYGVRCLPHNYGGYYGNYAQAHLAAALENYEMAEWDECHVDGIDDSGYYIQDGYLCVPDLPGFGLVFDAKKFESLCKMNGWACPREVL